MVVYAEYGQHTACHEGAGCDGSQYGVTIVEQIVGRQFIATTHKVGDAGKHIFPIIHGSARFEVVAIAAFHIVGPSQHIAYGLMGVSLENGSLIAYFGLHGLLPKLFSQRGRAIKLIAEALVRYAVGSERQQQAHRHVRTAAGHHSHIIVHESLKQSLSYGNLFVVEHHHSDIFYRDGAHSLFFDYFAHIVGFFHFRKPYHKLLVSKTQIRRIAEI